MTKVKKPTKSREAIPKLPARPAPPPTQSHALRETVESIVIAFVLAFLFRTFEAEAFVIPTGSMAPTLMGRHKDVDCPKCGYRYQVSASEEKSDNPRVAPSRCLAGMCPMCHYVLPVAPREFLPPGAPERRMGEIPKQRSYNGDRILVNKYIYTFSDPQRWDVVVFKFPGNAQMNYIKRLVGLPGETLRIYQGDLFVGGSEASRQDDFKIAQKPADKILAMRQLVHDTDHDPAELDSAGWPLRWHSPPGDEGDAWKLEKSVDDNIVRQRYSVKAAGDGEAWLRYEHVPPDYEVWRGLAAGRQIANLDRSQVRRLITDSNPYNARVDERNRQPDSLRIDPSRLGLHWVGDLMLDADVEVEAAEGELLLDLVEGGRHFTCTIDLKSGDATLSAEGAANFTPKAKTPISSAGSYHVALANVDDQLLLWVDDKLIAFDGSTAYDVAEVFGSRDGIRPHTSDDDLGDLAPAGIGARGAKLAVTRLQLWRDIYYIAVKWRPNDPVNPMADFDVDYPNTILDLDRDPSRWDLFGKRRHEDFRLTDDQFFVMGDNSAESSDARLWCGPSDHGGKPGGEYLERRLLIGKALCVYWPHSWNRVPGTPIPFPLFPNFADMRLVR